MSKDPIIEQAEKEKEEFLNQGKSSNKKSEDNAQPSVTETPRNTLKKPLLTKPITYKEVEEKVDRLLPNSSAVLKIVLAVAVSAIFRNIALLWMLLVGTPSSGKTEIVKLTKDALFTYYLDTLTLNAFVSGERQSEKQPVHDLLPQLHKKCFVIKDWTSIFSLDEKATKKLLGDLVNIYDQEFAKFSSRRGNISYTSEFSHLGCITPATLNKHTNYLNMVGPRFLFYTMPDLTEDEEDISFAKILDEEDREAIEKEARLYTSSYLTQLAQQDFTRIQPFNKDVKNYLKVASKLMANCRGIVMLQAATFVSNEGKEVKYYDVLEVQIERPWRALYQLTELAKYLAFVVGKDEVGHKELVIIKDVVMSSMPADRAQALKGIKENGGKMTSQELSQLTDRSSKTSLRLLDELHAVKVLEKTKGIGTTANNYELKEAFKDFIILDPTEFMSSYLTSETETPHGVQTEDEKGTKGNFIASLGYKDENKGDEK